MIQANELRIGNWVALTGRKWRLPMTDIDRLVNGNLIQVESIHKIGINSDPSGGWFPIQSVLPIPLTPEILEKAGFERTGVVMWRETTDYKPNDVEWLKHPSLPDLIFGIDHRGDNEWKLSFGKIELEHVKYVHQLQNLHFSLTGDELKIEL